MRIIYFFVLLGLLGCGPKDADLTVGDIYFFAARCDVQDNSYRTIVCIEYDNYLSTTLGSDCISHRDAFGGANYSFSDTQGDSGCSSSGRVGVCENSDGKFHFYNSKYSAGAAQTECNTLGGTFSN